MLLIIFIVLWAFSLFYGISLIRTDRRKLGIRYLIIFSIPLVIFLIVFSIMDFEYLNCMLNGSSDAIAYCSTLK